MKRVGFALSTSLAFAFQIVSTSVEAAEYFEGKSINLIVGNPAGGGYDAYARLLARHMPKHLPGTPKFIVRNMPGAGGLTMANHMFSIAPRDGLTIGLMNRSVPLAPILGNSAAKFRSEEFTWLGTSTSFRNDAYLMFVDSKSPYKTLADLQRPGPSVVFGGDGIGNSASDLILIAKSVFNLNIKVIVGYHSSGEIGIAMERGEVTGRALGMSTLRLLYKDALRDGRFHYILQYRERRWDQLPDIPTARELVAPSDRPLIELAELPLVLARVFMAPPQLPPEVASSLKAGFMATHADPAYQAEASKLQLDVSPLDGDTIQSVMVRLRAIPPEVIQKYNAALEDRQ